MFKGEAPCKNCRNGLHRICEAPVQIPTILTFLRGAKNLQQETLVCCDRREFWTLPLYWEDTIKSKVGI
jgi:hypothetical protein